jgi:hypothetical protein
VRRAEWTRRLAAFGAAAAVVVCAAPAAGAPRQLGFLQAAEAGVAQAHAYWWDARRGWYDERLDPTWQPNRPLVRLWSAYPLFEALNAIAIAAPTPAHRAAVRAFAAKAEQYWNPYVEPSGAYAYYIHTVIGSADTFFDDNGWWGIAFLDAYRATRDRRYLLDAEKALGFIMNTGWDQASGGTWWETFHRHKTSEPLAAAAYVAAGLYLATGERKYLAQADSLMSWADVHSWNAARGLYARSAGDPTVLNYVEGMMIGARLELCQIPGREDECLAAERLARAAVVAFPGDWEPAPDVIYLRFLLDLYRQDGNRRWYDLVAAQALRAERTSRVRGGLYLNRWDGSFARGHLLRFHAATTSLFAWLGATAPPP